MRLAVLFKRHKRRWRRRTFFFFQAEAAIRDAPSSRFLLDVYPQQRMGFAQYFFFFSSHFDHVSNEARVNSAKLLVQKVQEIAGDLPYFCTGDLNCDPDEEPISFILNSGLFKDSYSISETTPKGPAGTLHYWNFDFNPEHRIDYILVEKSIKVLSFETITDDARQGRFSSDHYPIMIKAEL